MQVDLWMCICGWTCSGCCFSFVDCFSIIKFFTYGGGVTNVRAKSGILQEFYISLHANIYYFFQH